MPNSNYTDVFVAFYEYFKMAKPVKFGLVDKSDKKIE